MPRYHYAQTFPRLISLSLSLFIWTCIPSLSIKVSPSLAWYPSCTHQAWWFQDNLVLGIRVAIPINSLNSQPCKQPGPQANQARLVLTHQCMLHLHHILKSNDFFKPLGVGQNRFPSRLYKRRKKKQKRPLQKLQKLLTVAPLRSCWGMPSVMHTINGISAWSQGADGLWKLRATPCCGRKPSYLVLRKVLISDFPSKIPPPLCASTKQQKCPPLKPPGPLQLLLVVAHRSQRHHNWEK